MADVKSIYDLILSGQPGGGYSGIYKPSGPVMLPPQGMGSNQALGKLLSDPTGPGPDSGALSGMLDDPIYSGGGAGPYSGKPVNQDRLMPSSPGYGSGTGLNANVVMAMGDPGTNQGTGSRMSPAQKAIALATGGGDLNWEDANPAAMAPGQTDPWAGSRIGSAPQTTGLTTGNTGRNIASHLPAGSPISGLFTGGLGGMFGNTPMGKLVSGLRGISPSSSQPMGLAALPSFQGYSASTDPNAGQSIQTNNNGTQVVGERLNNSPKGYTVTGDSWFNSVRGL